MHQTLQVTWPEMIFIERRLLAGLMLGLDDRYREWGPLEAAGLSTMKYRQVQNALRRLVPCGWVVRVRRGVYHLTQLAVDFLTPRACQGVTLTSLQAAQAPRARSHSS